MLAVAGDRNRFAQQLFAPLPHRYDQLAEVLSLGQNGRWRWAMIDRIAFLMLGVVLTFGAAAEDNDTSNGRTVRIGGSRS